MHDLLRCIQPHVVRPGIQRAVTVLVYARDLPQLDRQLRPRRAARRDTLDARVRDELLQWRGGGPSGRVREQQRDIVRRNAPSVLYVHLERAERREVRKRDAGVLRARYELADRKCGGRRRRPGERERREVLPRAELEDGRAGEPLVRAARAVVVGAQRHVGHGDLVYVVGGVLSDGKTACGGGFS